MHLLALTEWFIEFCQSIEVNPLDFPGSRLLRSLIRLVSSPAYRTRPPESLDYYHLDELAYDLGDFYDVEFGSCSADEGLGRSLGLFRAGYLPHMGILALFPWVAEKAAEHKRCTNCLSQKLERQAGRKLAGLLRTARVGYVDAIASGPRAETVLKSWQCAACEMVWVVPGN